VCTERRPHRPTGQNVPAAPGMRKRGPPEVYAPMTTAKGNLAPNRRKARQDAHLCRSTRPGREMRRLGQGRGSRIVSQVIGASEGAKTADAGRIAAEWSLTRSMVSRSSWSVRRGRASGGAMATGKRVLPGAPVVAGSWAAPGRAMTSEHAIRAELAVAAWRLPAAREVRPTGALIRQVDRSGSRASMVASIYAFLQDRPSESRA